MTAKNRSFAVLLVLTGLACVSLLMLVPASQATSSGSIVGEWKGGWSMPGGQPVQYEIELHSNGKAKIETEQYVGYGYDRDRTFRGTWTIQKDNTCRIDLRHGSTYTMALSGPGRAVLVTPEIRTIELVMTDRDDSWDDDDWDDDNMLDWIWD